MSSKKSVSLVEMTRIITNQLTDLNTKSDVPWELKTTEDNGRGVFATRDISVHEFILRDYPLILGPRFNQNQLVCVVCYKILTNVMENVCRAGCSLLLCENCQNSIRHQKECDFIKGWQPKNPERISLPVLAGLCSIRGVLLDEKAKELMCCLQGNLSVAQQEEINRLCNEFQNSNEIESYKKMLYFTAAVLDTNAFETILGPERQNLPTLRGLYPLAGMLNHSCIPNTRYSFDEEHTMIIRASMPVKKGEEILNCYCKTLFPTQPRQILLRQTKQFSCVCDRCSDVTEFGSNLSAMNCVFENCGGYLFPSNPVDIRTKWSCTECDRKHPCNKIFMMQNMMSSFIGKKMEESIDEILEFIEHKLPKCLPPTNHLAMDIKLFVIWRIGNSDDSKI